MGELTERCTALLGAPGATDEGAAALSWLLEELERELSSPPVQRSLLGELWLTLTLTLSLSLSLRTCGTSAHPPPPSEPPTAVAG